MASRVIRRLPGAPRRPGRQSAEEGERFRDLQQAEIEKLLQRIALAEEELARHVRIHEFLDRRIVALEDVRRPSNAAVRAFVLLPARVGGSLFSLKELFERIATLRDEELLDAFMAAGVSTPRKAGRMFRQLEGRVIEGYRLRRDSSDRDGILWFIERF